MQPSSLAWNISYAPGASSSGNRWVRRSRTPNGSCSAETSGRRSSTHRRDVRLAHPQGQLAVEQVHHRQRVDRAAVDARDGHRAPAPREPIAVCRAASRSMPAFSIAGRARASGRKPASLWAVAAADDPCASMPTASMVASAPRPSVRSRTADSRSSTSEQVDHVDTVPLAPWPGARARGRGRSPSRLRGARRCARPSARSGPGRPPRRCRRTGPRRTPRPATRWAGRRRGRGTARRARVVGYDDRPVLSLRHPQVLRLAAGDLPVQLRVAEEGGAAAWSRTCVVSHCDWSPCVHMKHSRRRC